MTTRFLFLAALLIGAGAQAANAQISAAAPAVSVIEANTRELVDTVVVTGTLVAREEALVGPEVEGLRITEVLVEEGETVARGQVLARLSRAGIDAQLAQNSAALDRLDAAIAQARSRIAEAEATVKERTAALERARSLQRTGVASEATLDQREAAARAAQAQLASSRDGVRLAEAQRAEAKAQRRELTVQAERTEIKAPVGGVISRRSAKVGAIAARQGEPMFRIVSDGQIELEADVSETVLGRLREGMPAQVLPVGREAPAAGQVRLISPEVNRTTRLGRVRIAVAREPGLVVGSFGRGTIELARRTNVAVPISAVQFNAGGAQVQVVKDGVVETRPIELGIRGGGHVEALRGLAAGERVVAISGTFLRNGDRVRAMPAAAR